MSSLWNLGCLKLSMPRHLFQLLLEQRSTKHIPSLYQPIWRDSNHCFHSTFLEWLLFSDTMKASGSVGNFFLISRLVGFLFFSSFSKLCLPPHALSTSLGDLRLTILMHTHVGGSNILLLGDILRMSFPSPSKCAAHKSWNRINPRVSLCLISPIFSTGLWSWPQAQSPNCL